MNSNSSPQVIFAVLIGAALVLGAIVLNNLTDRLASAPALHEPQVPQELPDLQASSMREANISRDDWLQTVPEQNVPVINVSGTVSGTYQPAETLARQFGVDVFTETIQAGANDVSPEEFERRLSDLAKDYVGRAQAASITGADIQLALPDSPQSIRSYMNEMADIFITYSPTNSRERTELFQVLVEHKDETAVDELQQVAASYQTMREQYLTVTVPRQFVTAHVAVINALAALQGDLDNAAKFLNDPLAGQIGMTRYLHSSTAFTRALQNLGIETIRYENEFDFAEDSALLFVLTLPDVSS